MIENLPTQNKRSWFLVGSVVALVLVAALSVYFEMSKRSTQRAVNRLEQEKQALLQAAQEKQSSTPQVSGVSLADLRASVATIRTQQISWAKIIEKIENTIPKDKETGAAIIQFRSYNASSDGEISVSALTRAGRLDPFGDIAELIGTFTNDPSFKKIFVPSITKSIVNQEGVEGAIVLSFSMNFHYTPQTLSVQEETPKPVKR